MLARNTAGISASAAHSSASWASPAALRCSRRQQCNREGVNYEMDSCNAARRSGSSAEVLPESGEVMPAAAADYSACGPAPARGAGRFCAPAADVVPAPEASAPAGCGFRHRPAWVTSWHDLLAPNSFG